MQRGSDMADFDLLQLDTLTLAEQGVAMPIIDLRTNRVMINDDGSEVTITLLGRHSEVFRTTTRQIQEKRLEMRQEGKTVDADHLEKEDIITLIACTRNWTIKKLGPEEFPCTPPNIRRLWTDKRFRSLRETAIAFIMGDANFLPKTERGSSDLLASSSPSDDPSSVVEHLPMRSAATA